MEGNRMQIRDMFQKPIDRDIKGVIKVGQGDSVNIKQELEEYVITRELNKHFADFFASYKRGINGHTDKMGVWISGFFGSGKSHFLKILSYLLANQEVEGKRAIDYFIDDNKIADPMTLADMKLATTVPTDVVLFNIDSKSEMSGKESKDAIVNVFLKVFNEMQGFCGAIPALADLERKMVNDGIYETFKEKFEASHGSPWEETRTDFDFIQDDIVDVLVEMDFMSEEAARNWCEKATESYNISIERFADLVKKYIDSKGKNHHVVFLVDEIGQYIGDDSKLMLNLQTVTEDLGTACGGKAWIIVTSQQDIDSITKTKGNDFSKIQGRFDTRLSLSSANVDEVIRKRILAKNEVAEQTLSLLYEQKATIIKNLIVFNDGIEKKLYSDSKSFADVYPFVPYQFNLLGSVLTSIRTHGASGKHLSEGERSMIALFKESASHIKEEEEGRIIPFNVFYDALHQFLDHSHKGVISKAWENDYLNPDREEDNFNINVLKTLFMIKYVKEITANVENITSLMVDHIDTDRLELTKRVEEALKKLTRQMLVQKNGDIYVFLTDEEQEINREIESQNVEISEVIAKVSELIFDGLYDEKKYRYGKFSGRYTFAFNQMVDDRPYKSNQNHDIGIKILTPSWDGSTDETTLKLMSGQERNVIVVLPNNAAFIEEIRSSLKIEKYLRLNTTSTLAKFNQIKEAKRIEMRDRSANAHLFLEESLKNADIYVNGDKAQINKKDVTARMNEAIGKLVDTVYHKLYYIDAPMTEAHIRGLFKTGNQVTLELQSAAEPNKLALNDMNDYIASNSVRHTKTSMKTLMDRFMKAPYGFVEDDVEWLVAKLFKNGDIALSVSSEPITLLNKGEDEIVRYITNKSFVEKLMTEKREKANDKQKKAVREVMKHLFDISTVQDDDDAMMRQFQSYAKKFIEEIEKLEIMYDNEPKLPGKAVALGGKKLLREVLNLQYTAEFFKEVDANRDEYLDLAEDFEPVRGFFNGGQKAIFEKAIKLVNIYDQSKTFIVDEEIEGIVAEIKGIMNKTAPYGEIHKLPDLLDRYASGYSNLLETMSEPIMEVITESRNRVTEALDQTGLKDLFINRVTTLFDELVNKCTTCNNVATLQNIRIEADALKTRLLNEIQRKQEEQAAGLAAKKAKEEADRVAEEAKTTFGDQAGPVPTPTPVVPQPKVKRNKTVSIRTINTETTWRIETKQDVEKYIDNLRRRLENQLEEDTIINIEF